MELNAMNGRSTAMMKDLIQATRATAARAGPIDGVPLEWDDGQSWKSRSPLLRLRPVGAQFKGDMFPATWGAQKGHRVVFGWVNNPTEIREKSPSDQVWNLTLSCSGDAFTWDVNRNEIVGASSVELAEQIVRQLIEFRNEYTNSAG
jgi:hypothetical protein